MKKRIDYYGQFTPSVDSSDVKRFEALAGLSDVANQLAVQVAQTKAQREGAEAGELAGLQAAQTGPDGELPSAPEQREGFFSSLNIYDQAYNKAAINGYTSGVLVDARKKLYELEEANQTNPNAKEFGNQWEAYVQGVTKGLPPAYKEKLRLSLDDDGFRVGARIAEAQRDKVMSEAIADVNQNFDDLYDAQAQAAFDGDELEVAKIGRQIENLALDNVELIDPVESQEKTDKQASRLIIQSNLGQVERFFQTKGTLEEQVEAAEQFLRDMIAKPSIEGLSPEEREGLQTAIQTRITKREQQLAVVDLDEGLAISDLKVAVASGLLTPEEVDERTETLFREKRISESTMTSLRNQSRTAQQAARESARTNQQFAKMFSDEGNPFFAPTQSEVNEHYREVYAPKFENGTTEQRLLSMYSYIENVKQVPDAVKITVNAMLLSGDEEQVTQAAMFLDRTDEIPGKFNAVIVDSGNRAFAQKMVQYQNAGIPSGEAYKLAQKYIDEDAAKRVELRTEQIKETFDDDLDDWTEKATGLKPGDRGFADARNQYQFLFNAQYLEGADEEGAKRFAERVLKSNYTESIFGPMMYAPEQYWADSNGSVEYIKQAIADDVRMENPELEFDEDEDIFLLTDDTTARQASVSRPTYRVMIRDSNGELSIRAGRFDPAADLLTRTADTMLSNMILAEGIREGEPQSSVEKIRQQLKGSDDPARDIAELRRQAGIDVRSLVAQGIRNIPEAVEQVADATGGTVEMASRVNPTVAKFVKAPAAVQQAYSSLLELQQATLANLSDREESDLIDQVEQ